jgi:hypothetical protein
MTCAMKFQDDRKVQFTVSRDTYDKLRRMQDLLRHQVPDGDPAAIRREVVTKQRRALVVYGDGHLFRAGQSLVGQLERDAGIKVFTIATAMSTMFEDLSALQPDLSSWPIPSLGSRSRDGARCEAARIPRRGSLSRTSVCDYVLSAACKTLL